MSRQSRYARGGSRQESPNGGAGMLWRTESAEEEALMELTGFILGGIGILFLIVGTVMTVRLRSFLSGAAATRGTVVGFVKQSSGSDGGTSKHAQVEYATEAGETVTFTETSQTMGGLKVGSDVPVKYDPAQPRKARIASSGRLWATPVMLFVLGVALVIVGVILLMIGD